MTNSNGIVVRLKGVDGTALDEVKPNDEEPCSFRYRLISAAAGAKFEVSVTVGKSFDWKAADCLFIAIAYDDGEKEHLGSIDYTMAWAISRNKNHLGEQLFTWATRCEKDEPNATLLKTAYSMPTAATGVSNIKRDKLRHLSKSALVSHRSCISVYVHRGRLISNPTKRRPADPVSSFLESTIANIAKSTARRLKINFESFKPLSGTDGNVCEFHFRNIISGEYMKHKARASTKATSKDAGPATPTNDRRTTRGAATAKRKRVLRELPRPDYSLRNLFDKTGYESDDDQIESAQEEPETSCRGQQGHKKRRVISLGDEEDDTEDEDDDEVIIIEDPRKVMKTEPRPEEQAPLQTVEERQSVPASTSASNSVATQADGDKSVSENRASDKAKEKRALEMAVEDNKLRSEDNKLRREELELKREALALQRQLAALEG